MNRFRLIDKVSIYLLDRNNCHITLLYRLFLTGLCLYITCLATVYTKGNWFDDPFVLAILGTKFLTTLCLVHQNNAQLRTCDIERRTVLGSGIDGLPSM